jgi:hypothetical protein
MLGCLGEMVIPASMICHCLRCGHEWVRRIVDRPKRCPKCISPYWDTKPGKLRRGRPPRKAAAKHAKRKAGG